jgi:hypothetical protein
MRLRVFAAVFTVLALTAILSAQATSNSSAGPAATAQASQSGTTSAEDIADDKAGSGRKTHVRFGGLTVAAGYAYGPAFYPYYAFAPYGLFPYYAYPFWGAYGAYSYYPLDMAYGADKGELQLKADAKDAELYIDGAYAGTVRRLKNIWLDPGAYNLSVSAAGRETFKRRVYVLTGKTLDISANLALKPDAGKNEVKP